jgi:hypothetical protein
VTGWILGDLLIDEPAMYQEWGTWSIVIPNAGRGYGTDVVTYWGEGKFWWTLQVHIAPTVSGLPKTIGYPIIALHPELYERFESVSVWTYMVTKRVVRASYNVCTGSVLPTRRNEAWPYVTVFMVATDSHAYHFAFTAPDPDSSVVRQIIDSINISK